MASARLGSLVNDAEVFAGDLDEVRIHGRPLGDDEVAALNEGGE